MMTPEEALVIYHSGPETVVRVLLEMDARPHTLNGPARNACGIWKGNWRRTLTSAASRRPPTV